MTPKVQYALVGLALVAAIVISSISLDRAIRATELARRAEHRADQMETQASEFRQHSKDLEYVKLLRLAAAVDNAVKMGDKDQFDRALKIRNHIHKDVPSKPSKEWFDTMDIGQMYRKTMRDEGTGHLCAGLTLLYVAALESQGIPARYVGIFSDDKEPYTSHATAEFWHDGKWYASDPTNNIMFMHKGEYLSYAELYDLVKEGKSFDVVTNGYPVLPERKIDNYKEALKGFMKYMVIHPNNVWRGHKLVRDTSNVQTAGFNPAVPPATGAPKHLPPGLGTDSSRGNLVRYPMQLLPNSWDGGITFRGGERRDVRAFGGIYSFLHDGPLR